MNITTMQAIKNLNEIQLTTADYFVFVFKSGSEQSQCALENLTKAVSGLEIPVYAVDVNESKEVHEKIGVKSVPTLVHLRENKVLQQVKGCQAESFFHTLLSGDRFTSFGSTNSGGGSSVIMYTTPTCTYCNSLKSYLTDKNVSFTEIDVSKDQKAAEDMVKRSGQQGVPQTLIDGQVVIGFDRNKINQLLNIE